MTQNDPPTIFFAMCIFSECSKEKTAEKSIHKKKLFEDCPWNRAGVYSNNQR